MAKSKYIKRRYKVCTHLRQSICKESGIETAENWYLHIPKAVCDHEDVTVLWIEGVQTGREVLGNGPHIVIKNKTDPIWLLIDVRMSSDRNAIQKKAEKELKYKNLSI
jgi:hypothetical protein